MRTVSASLLLTNHYRMQISRRKYIQFKKAVIKLQASFRGVSDRRLFAAIMVETYYRKHRARRAFKMLRSSVIALQCKIRCKIAKKEVGGLKGEQKNIGKLRENNERLKMEMNSLKAMLAAQAKEDASNVAHTSELQVKQDEITKLENRVAELETQLAEEKAIIEKLEMDLRNQQDQAAGASATTTLHRKQRSGQLSPKKAAASAADTIDPSSDAGLQMPTPPSNYVSPDVLAKHKHKLSKIEQELRSEKNLRREADGEVIKLRAAINGVQLSDAEVKDLLYQKQQEAPSAKESLRYVVIKYRTRICQVDFLLVHRLSCIFICLRSRCDVLRV